ncbi:MAG TPA: hypothetical protein VN285_12810 [Candidatus Deferrimicrobium sp.]|nr:hypothetical protein [Candidatus Deferrimicrobium sp.]
MTTEIIIDLRLLENQKSAKAVGNVTLATNQGDATILGVRVIHQDDKAPWVAFPQIEYDSKVSGKKERKNVLSFSHRLDKAIKDAVLAKYRELSGSGVPF